MSEREPTGKTVSLRRPGAAEPKPMTAAARAWLRAAFLDNATLKLVAFMLALTVFFLVHSDKRAVVNLTVSVSYSVPSGKVIALSPPDEVRLTLRGSRRLVKRVDEREIERIHIDLPDTTGEFVFQNDMVRLPAGLELVSINPASFPLRLEEPIERPVPVRIETTGEVPAGYEVVNMTLEPNETTITGAESVVRSITAVSTRPVNLEGRTTSFIEELALSQPEELVTISEETQSVRAKVVIAKKIGTVVLGKRPVQLVGGPNIAPDTAAKFVADPPQVEVVLSGPVLALEAIDPALVTVEAMVTAADLVPNHPRRVALVARGLPEGVGSEIRPNEVTISLP